MGPCYSLTNDDAELSFCWAKNAVEEYDGLCGWDGDNPNVTLAWHYFYGIGCEKDIEKAKQLIRTACTENGEYAFPALMQIIKDMGLDNELKYNPELDYLHLDEYE